MAVCGQQPSPQSGFCKQAGSRFEKSRHEDQRGEIVREIAARDEMRIPIATQSEAPQLVDIEQARKLEEEAETAEAEEVAAEEGEEQTTNEFQETTNEANEGFQWDGDGDDGDDTTFACSFDYEDDSSSAKNLQWWDGDDEDDDDYEDHQEVKLDDITEDLSTLDVDLNNEIEQQQQHLVEIQSPTFYFHGQMPDPLGEKGTFGKYVDRDGTIYDGRWQGHHYHGYGSLFDPVENSFFVGQFENSQMEGRGWMSYFDDGIVISGKFSASTDIVQGTIRYPSGDMYVGDIKGKLMHGRGFLYYSRGDWIALISNEFEEGSLNGAEGIIIEADGLTLHHATFISGTEENTLEIDETIGVYTMEELGLGYEDILAFGLLGTNMTDPLLLRTFDYLSAYHGSLGDDMATPNWRDWDMADWLVVTSAFCLVVPLLRPVVLRRIIRFLAFDILKMVHQYRYKYW